MSSEFQRNGGGGDETVPVADSSSSNNSSGVCTPSRSIGAPARNARKLTADRDVWSHNAWDDVEWTEEQLEAAAASIERQKENPVPLEKQEDYNAAPAEFWNRTYSQSQDRMYMDRSWLAKEFEELREAMQVNEPRTVVELGSGPGNTAYPLLRSSTNTALSIHALDYSSTAIELFRANPEYSSPRIQADVWDLSAPDDSPLPFPEQSADVAICIFVLSALHPDQLRQAIRNILRMLKPGGRLLFRDFGRYDLCQLRFRKERWMQDHLYVRGDGTRVNFFDLDEFKALVTSQQCDGHQFKVVDSAVDKRLILNRKRQIQMHRVWLQATFEKATVQEG